MNSKDWTLLVFIIALIVLVVMFWDKFVIRKEEIIEADYCKTDNDCVVAIHPGYCCDCPRAYNREFVGIDEKLFVYEEGVDYSNYEKIENCAGIACGACGTVREVSCENNKCVMRQNGST